MAIFTENSLVKLNTCHSDLQKLCLEVVRNFPCVVVWGYRGREDQNKFCEKGTSTKVWPYSKHNQMPALAVDLVPLIKGKIIWEIRQCYFFAGYVLRVAENLGIDVILGADWNMDRDINDQILRDVCHFELKG